MFEVHLLISRAIPALTKHSNLILCKFGEIQQSPISSQNYNYEQVFGAENELGLGEEQQQITDDVEQSNEKLEMEDAIDDDDISDPNYTQSTSAQQAHQRTTYHEVARFADAQAWRQWMTKPEQQLWAKWGLLKLTLASL